MDKEIKKLLWMKEQFIKESKRMIELMWKQEIKIINKGIKNK